MQGRSVMTKSFPPSVHHEQCSECSASRAGNRTHKADWPDRYYDDAKERDVKDASAHLNLGLKDKTEQGEEIETRSGRSRRRKTDP